MISFSSIQLLISNTRNYEIELEKGKKKKEKEISKHIHSHRAFMRLVLFDELDPFLMLKTRLQVCNDE